MRTKSKDAVSVRSDISSTGDDLGKKKTSFAKGLIKEECKDDQCEGIQNLRALQNYVKASEKGAAAEPDDEQESKMQVVEAGKPAPIVTESKSAIRRKARHPPENPFWTDTKRQDHPLLPIPRAPRTVEIRGGDVLGQCECVKRNGLQHDCPKWECRGEELCLTWPMPTCQPSGLGVPIIVESRVKRPDPANCELTTEEKKAAEKAAAVEKRKEEIRLVEQARSDWKTGKELAAIQKAANQQKGYMKCNIHSGKYRLVPLMRDEITQTPDELCTCPCDELEDKLPNKVDSKVQPSQPQREQQERASEQAPAEKKETVQMESVRTSTTGIPTANKLKSFIKKK